MRRRRGLSAEVWGEGEGCLPWKEERGRLFAVSGGEKGGCLLWKEASGLSADGGGERMAVCYGRRRRGQVSARGKKGCVKYK